MSQHILQQFDEQLLAEIAGGGDLPGRGPLPPSTARHGAEIPVHRGRASGAARQWLLLAAALLMAALALLLASDAQRRADDLQRRLAAYERATDKNR
jgi:uncharacterized iron-regulated membrane protein